MQVSAGTGQASDERTDLWLGLLLDRGADELEGCGPAFGAFVQVDEDVWFQRALVGVAEQALRLGLVEAEVLGGEGRDCRPRSVAAQRELRVGTSRKQDRDAIGDAVDEATQDLADVLAVI